MEILFTKRAEESYSSIKNYIINKWGKKVADAFEQKTKDFLDLLEVFPEMGALGIKGKEIRGFQLTKQTKVFYRIKNQKIIILIFFDVRQNPNKMPI